MLKQLEPKDRHTNCNYCNYMGCNSSSLIHHVKFIAWLHWSKHNPKRVWKRLIMRLTALDYSKLDDLELDGIDTRDYPDFCDAYIASGTYKGRELTDKQLDRLNNDSSFVHELVLDRLY